MDPRSAIRDTIERFHDAVNRRSPADVAALFAENATWEVAPPFTHTFTGRAAIETGITGTIGATEVLIQSVGPVVIDIVDASRATARTSMQEFGRFRTGASMHVAGTYHDELARQDDGSWRFVHRRFVAHYADELPVPGRALLAPDVGAAQSTVVPVAAPVERQAITEMIARFASAVGVHDMVAASELFADGAVWTSSAGGLSFHHEGRAAIRDFLTNSSAKVAALYYMVGVPSVTLLGADRARSQVAFVEVLHIKATGERRLLLGTYADELAKRDGVWQFAKRHATVNHAETLHGAPAP